MLEDVGQFMGAGFALLSILILSALFLMGPWDLYESPLMESRIGRILLARLEDMPDADLSKDARDQLSALIKRHDMRVEQIESPGFGNNSRDRFNRLQRLLDANASDEAYLQFTEYRFGLCDAWIAAYAEQLYARSFDDALRHFSRDVSRSGRFLFGLAFRDHARTVARAVFRTVSATVTDWTTGGVLIATTAWLVVQVLIGDQSFVGYVGTGAALGAFLGIGRSDFTLLRRLSPQPVERKEAIWRDLSFCVLVLIGAPVSALIVLNAAHFLATVVGPSLRPPATVQASSAVPVSQSGSGGINGLPTAGRISLFGFGVICLGLSARYGVRKWRAPRSPLWERMRKCGNASLGVLAAICCFVFAYIRGQDDDRIPALVLSAAFMVSFLAPLTLYGLAAILKRQARWRSD